MAIHYSISSMLQESLVEMVLAAEQLISYRKDPGIWGSAGCLGWPAATLLLATADSIGSYVVGGSVRNHFNILNHPDFYNLNLGSAEIKIIYEDYRCLLTHNSALPVGASMDIGTDASPVFESANGGTRIYLLPLLLLTKVVVRRFLLGASNANFNENTLRKIFRN